MANKKSAVTKAKAAPVSPVLAKQIKPLDDRIVVKVLPVELKTAGGLFIPESMVESAYQRGEVIAVGAGHRTKKGVLKPVEIKPGDIILFGKFVGEKIEVNGDIHFIVRESEVLGVQA